MEVRLLLLQLPLPTGPSVASSSVSGGGGGAVGHCQDWPNHSSVPSNLQLCNNTVSAQDCASPIMCSIYYWGERREAPLFWVVRNRKTWYVAEVVVRRVHSIYGWLVGWTGLRNACP